jgi:hypothetical protein
MSSRFCASIRIGGTIEASKIEPLVLAIRAAGVACEWGDATFEPQTHQELLDARKDGHLWLCDEQANYGEFPEIEAVCRKLDLGYTRHSEASFDSDAELLIWRTGMKKPIVRAGSNINEKDTFVPNEAIRRALALLERGHIDKALRTLRNLCPDIPELPPFEII